jgi:hypothetical protein
MGWSFYACVLSCELTKVSLLVLVFVLLYQQCLDVFSDELLQLFITLLTFMSFHTV